MTGEVPSPHLPEASHEQVTQSLHDAVVHMNEQVTEYGRHGAYVRRRGFLDERLLYGIDKLIKIAVPNELNDKPHPDAVPMQEGLVIGTYFAAFMLDETRYKEFISQTSLSLRLMRQHYHSSAYSLEEVLRRAEKQGFKTMVYDDMLPELADFSEMATPEAQREDELYSAGMSYMGSIALSYCIAGEMARVNFPKLNSEAIKDLRTGIAELKYMLPISAECGLGQETMGRQYEDTPSFQLMPWLDESA